MPGVPVSFDEGSVYRPSIRPEDQLIHRDPEIQGRRDDPSIPEANVHREDISLGDVRDRRPPDYVEVYNRAENIDYLA